MTEPETKTNKKMFTCECGRDVLFKNKLKHIDTTIHKIYMNAKSDSEKSSKSKGRGCFSETHETIFCECGGHYNATSQYSHCRSKMHMDYIESQNPVSEKKVDTDIKTIVYTTLEILRYLKDAHS